MHLEIKMGDLGRARLYLARINMAIVKEAGARRMGHRGRGAAPGARPPASIANGRMETRVLTEPTNDGKPARTTPLGYRTARRRLPAILAALTDNDPRLRAALALADAAEKVGSVKGAALDGGGTKGGVSDGGATTRVKHAARLVLIEALANGWPVDRCGRVKRGHPRPALPVQRQRGEIKEIGAFSAIWALAVEGRPAQDLLKLYGWTVNSRNRRELKAGMLAALDDVADGLGFGRWERKDA